VSISFRVARSDALRDDVAARMSWARIPSCSATVVVVAIDVLTVSSERDARCKTTIADSIVGRTLRSSYDEGPKR